MEKNNVQYFNKGKTWKWVKVFSEKGYIKASTEWFYCYKDQTYIVQMVKTKEKQGSH